MESSKRHAVALALVCRRRKERFEADLSFSFNKCPNANAPRRVCFLQINRVSFMQGIVVLWCKHCNQKHLIADNLGKVRIVCCFLYFVAQATDKNRLAVP